MYKSPFSGPSMSGSSMSMTRSGAAFKPPGHRFIQVKMSQPAAAVMPTAPLIPVVPWGPTGLPASTNPATFTKALRR